MANSAPPATNIFSQLPAELSEPLFRRVHRIRLRANQTLFLAGDRGDGCYRIDEGLLKATVASTSGAELIVAILAAGDMVGELSMIDGRPRSTSVGAIRDSVVSFISRADFQWVAERNPDIFRHISILLADRLRSSNTVVAAASFLSLNGRVARVLLNLADAFGQDIGSGRIVIRQRISQNDLAAMAGIARESVSRVINDWKRLAIVSQQSGYYCLEKSAELLREAEL
jgi:CRP-like cAMP-binding protein